MCVLFFLQPGEFTKRRHGAAETPQSDSHNGDNPFPKRARVRSARVRSSKRLHGATLSSKSRNTKHLERMPNSERDEEFTRTQQRRSSREGRERYGGDKPLVTPRSRKKGDVFNVDACLARSIQRWVKCLLFVLQLLRRGRASPNCTIVLKYRLSTSDRPTLKRRQRSTRYALHGAS